MYKRKNKAYFTVECVNVSLRCAKAVEFAEIHNFEVKLPSPKFC